MSRGSKFLIIGVILAVVAAVALVTSVVVIRNNNNAKLEQKRKLHEATSAFGDARNTFIDSKGKAELILGLAGSMIKVNFSRSTAFSGTRAQVDPYIKAMETDIANMQAAIPNLSGEFKPIADQSLATAQTIIADYNQILAAGEAGDAATVKKYEDDLKVQHDALRGQLDQWINALRDAKNN